jgi:hypothetical protein
MKDVGGEKKNWDMVRWKKKDKVKKLREEEDGKWEEITRGETSKERSEIELGKDEEREKEEGVGEEWGRKEE